MIKTLKKELAELAHSQYRRIFLYYFLVTIFGGLLPVILVLMPQMIVSYVENQESFNKLAILIVILTTIVVVFSGISTYFKSASQANSLNFRTQEYLRLLKTYLAVDYEKLEDPLWLDFLEEKCSCLDSDNSGYQGTLNYLMKLLPSLVTSICYLVFLTMVSPILILLVIFYVIIAFISSSKAHNCYFKNRTKISRLNRHERYYFNTASDFNYAKDIRLFNLKNELLSLIDFEISGIKKIYRQISFHMFGWSLLEVLAMTILFGTSIYFIITNYSTNQSLANMLFNILVLTSLINLISSNAETVNYFVRGIKEVKDYYEFRDNLEPEYSTDKLHNINEPLEIEFKNVSFKYPNSDNYVLQNLSFKINAKERVAIVGANGAGKTTIVKLITGLFKPNEGSILINGIDINDFNLKELYQLYAVVFQDFNVYAFSILENISLKDTAHSNREKIVDILKREGLYETISNLKHQEDQMMLKYIDPEGVEFSGGQTQKLAIARALYKEGTKCVILDEPTSALDALAEADIYQSFSDLVKDKTAIYISHRMTSTKFCDRILLFDETGLAEVGSHDELMKLQGKYYELFNIQGKYYKKGGNGNEGLL